MLELNPIDLYALHSNNTTIPTVNSNVASFSDTLQSTASSSLDDIFQRAAEKYNVPVSLIKAIGKAESDFNPNAVSGAGAQGVMQLMPATAKSLGVTNSFDAEQNIMGGTKYIKQMLDRYNGNVKLALAAYNAGSGNVEKYGGIPPFKETQNYVKKVMNYAGETLTAGHYVPSQNSGVLNGAYNTSDTASLQSQIEQAILNFKELTEDDYLLFVESLKNDMSASLLKSISDSDYDKEDKKDSLFDYTNLLQNYNSILNQVSNTTDLTNTDYTVSGITSANANLLGSRFQTMYENE